MGRFIVRLFAVIGVIAVLLVAGAITAGTLLLDRLGAPETPPRMVLELDLRGGLPAGPPPSPIRRRFAGAPPTLDETIVALERAADDDRVAGVVARFGGDTFSAATAQSLRDAIARFRESGKPAIAHADSFGEFSPGTIAYYAASAFDRVTLQPGGTVGIVGLRSEVPFAAEALADLGIEPQVEKRGRYKTAPNTATETGLTPAHRAMLESVVSDTTGQIVAGIAESRGLDRGEVRTAVDRAPLLADEAASAGFVDGLVHWRDLVDEATAPADGGPTAERVDAATYLAVAPTPDEPDARVGVIYVAGLIAEGEGESGGVGPTVAGADRIAAALDEAARRDGIDAVILRIESGGGSPSASEVIRRAVVATREAGKPVIVSMGGAAASGGYWIAVDADTIVAQPATLTGSIGVFAGKPVLTDLLDDLGVSVEGVQQGRNADLFSLTVPYGENRERAAAMVDAIYDRFVTLVAEGRGLDRAAVLEVAEGRVWTGAQARELGLVDRLGGLGAAIDAAGETLGLEPGSTILPTVLPRPKSPVEDLMELAGGVVAAAAHAETMGRVASLVERTETWLLAPGSRALTMPEAGLPR
ncbi:MAG: S49 family peptidase [Azospirillaceae bacterium]